MTKNQSRKLDGRLPIVGVDTFLPPGGQREVGAIEFMSDATREKHQQVAQHQKF